MIPPRWFYRGIWAIHGVLDRISGGQLSTSRPRGRRLGVLFLVTRGRRSGKPRRNGLYYLEDGQNLLVLASNAGADADPGWWRNLQADPQAVVEIGGRARPVRARRATAAEEAAAWRRFVDASSQFAEYREATSREIAMVVLEPRDQPDRDRAATPARRRGGVVE